LSAGDLVEAIAGFGFCGFDFEPVLHGAVEREPRTLWACQSVAFMISARVAPLARSIIARIFASLLSARGAVALAASRLEDFLSAMMATTED
jgi:hypothetical protein